MGGTWKIDIFKGAFDWMLQENFEAGMACVTTSKPSEWRKKKPECVRLEPTKCKRYQASKCGLFVVCKLKPLQSDIKKRARARESLNTQPPSSSEIDEFEVRHISCATTHIRANTEKHMYSKIEHMQVVLSFSVELYIHYQTANW